MEKKKMTNKKKFWIGMSSLAAIGAITATVAYFSSVHEFNKDNFATKSYNVTATKVLDATAANAMTPNQELDANVSVKNEGDTPVLTRITYYFKSSLMEVIAPWNLSNENDWKFEVLNNDKFLIGSDNSYYYKGTIGNEEVQHLDKITYKGTGTAVEGSGVENDKGSNTKTITYRIGDNAELTVVIETIQATDPNGAALTVPESATAETLQGYWNNLGKGTPATPGGM